MEIYDLVGILGEFWESTGYMRESGLLLKGLVELKLSSSPCIKLMLVPKLL